MNDKTIFEDLEKTKLESFEEETLKKGNLIGWLAVIEGNQKGEAFRLFEGRNVVGSALPSRIILNDSKVSQEHMSIRYRDGRFYLFDLDSDSGILLNGEKVFHGELKDEDEIKIGNTVLLVKFL